jgi:hypothetical protein
MKKLLFLLLSVFFVLSLNSQTKNESISKYKINSTKLTAEYRRVVNFETNDSTYEVFIIFRNFKYSSIMDFQYIVLRNNDDFEVFKKDIKTALPEIDSKQKIHWNRDGLYSLYISDLGKGLNMYNENSLGYTVLNKKNAETFLAWLETIHFGE